MPHPALIVIDIQRDYFPNGAMALDQVEQAALQAKAALDYARDRKWPIVIVQHVSLGENATFFRPHTPGVELHPWFLPTHQDHHLIKHYANAFRETSLNDQLAGLTISELVICGMMTHLCIDSTVRQAADLGYRVTLLGDATATRTLTWAGAVAPAHVIQTAILAALEGSFAKVMTTSQWIRQAS